MGLHHWANGNFHGATVLMAEGIDRLREVDDGCQGVDVAALRADASALRAELLRLGADGMRDRDPRHALRVRLTARA